MLNMVFSGGASIRTCIDYLDFAIYVFGLALFQCLQGVSCLHFMLAFNGNQNEGIINNM